MMMRRFPVLLAALLTLGACSTLESWSQGGPAPQKVAEPDKVSALLADAADRASNALHSLAEIENQRGPNVAAAPIGDAPLELRQTLTVNWIGPADAITKTLADQAGYQFSVAGNAPAIPVVVSIDAENKPIIEILRDVGLQLGKRADVRVDANAMRVELHYPPNTGLL